MTKRRYSCKIDVNLDVGATVRQELDQELCEKYPAIFADRFKPMTETAMCWGFEHGDGWFTLIDTLCSNIQSYIDWKNRDGETVPQLVAEQVKEKFGTLRFYYRGGDEYTAGMITMAESISGSICISCGGVGKIKNINGWISNTCTNCKQQRS